jgi:hypothetical protein
MDKLPKRVCPVRNLSGAMNGKALFCRGVTAAAYLDGILGALFSEFVQRPLSSTFKPFPALTFGGVGDCLPALAVVAKNTIVNVFGD